MRVGNKMNGRVDVSAIGCWVRGAVVKVTTGFRGRGTVESGILLDGAWSEWSIMWSCSYFRKRGGV